MQKILLVVILICLSSCSTINNNVNSIESDDIQTSLQQSAKLAYSKGDFKKAADFYKIISTNYPNNNEYLFCYAQSLKNFGDYDLAKINYDKIIASKDANISIAAKEGKAIILAKEGMFVKSMELLSEIIDKDPYRWKSLNIAAIILAIHGQTEDALRYINVIINNQGDQKINMAAIYNNMALIYAIDKNYDKSITILNKMINEFDLDINQKKTIELNLALIYAIKGQINLSHQFAKRNLSEKEFNNNMGIYAKLANNDLMAKKYLENALNLTPFLYEKAWQNLSKIKQ